MAKNKPKLGHTQYKLDEYIIQHLQQKHRNRVGLIFSIFAKQVADIVGNTWSFIIALSLVIIWGCLGYFFKFSDTWQLFINTATTIVTFLIIFLIQNTQNRDTEIINLKLDELIRSHKNAKNSIINLADLSDQELKALEHAYSSLKNKRTGT